MTNLKALEIEVWTLWWDGSDDRAADLGITKETPDEDLKEMATLLDRVGFLRGPAITVLEELRNPSPEDEEPRNLL